MPETQIKSGITRNTDVRTKIKKKHHICKKTILGVLAPLLVKMVIV